MNLQAPFGMLCSLCNAAVFSDGSVTVPVLTSRCLQTPWNHCEQSKSEPVILRLRSGNCWSLSVIFIRCSAF